MNESIEEAYFEIEATYFNTIIKAWLINIICFIRQIAGMIGFAVIPYIKRFGSVKLFFTSVSLEETVKIVGVILNNTFSPFIMSFVNFYKCIASTAKADILQQEFSPNQRATMQSIIEVVRGIVAAIVIYLFGVLADLSSPKMTIISIVCVKIVLLISSSLVLKRKRHPAPPTRHPELPPRHPEPPARHPELASGSHWKSQDSGSSPE